jgi:beta-glucosidase
MKNTLLLLLCLFPLFLSAQNASKPVYLDPSKPLQQRVEDALSRMTLEEKVALCHAQSKFSSAGVPRLGIPEIWMSDGPHGVREEIQWDSWIPAGWNNDKCTAFPALTCLAATFNPLLAEAYGFAIGEEARYREKDILLGPGVNIYRSPMNGRNFEYMGEDPLLASKMVVPYVKGVQQNGVAACVKHFALNNQEVRRDAINVEVSDRALYEIYLPAFKAAVQEGGAWSIMGSYNKFRGEYCCHNDLLLNKILKQEWGFDGVVVSDWGGAHETQQAVFNGLDIEMGSYTNGMTSGARFGYNDYFLAKGFLQGIKNGQIPLAVLDDKVRRILRLEFRTNLAANRPFGRFVCEDHSATARKVAAEGIVLLKNDKNLLPILPGIYKHIAVIGENATRSLSKGGGSSELKTAYEVTPLDALMRVYGKDVISYSLGYASGDPTYQRVLKPKFDADTLLKQAVELASKSDLVVFVGGLNKNHLQDCEGGDRDSYGLPFGQEKLLEALTAVHKKVVVVLLSGNAVSMPWLAKIPALVQGWYMGSESGNALADVLSGAVNPSGKLPFTFPKRLEDNGAIHFGAISYPGVNDQQNYLDDILVGYRWHDTKKITPQFAFGFGLSFTSFALGKPQTDASTYTKDAVIKLSVTVENTGKIDGAEVVQVYASQLKPSVLRPVKELKAFQKVYLKAGEIKTVQLQLKSQDLAFYDEVGKGWKLEADDYVLQVGNSSDAIRGQVKINIH